jgi:hypothetical protein
MNRLIMELRLNSNANINRFGLILAAMAIAYVVAVILFIIIY